MRKAIHRAWWFAFSAWCVGLVVGGSAYLLIHAQTIPVPLTAVGSPGASVRVEPGEYATGSLNTRFGRGSSLVGPLTGKATLYSEGFTHSADGCAWEGNDGVLIQDVTLECRTGPGQQNQVVGFAGTGAVSNATMKLVRTNALGRTFGIYAWGGTANRILGYDGFAQAGKFAVMLGGGSGPDAQYVDLFGYTINVDYSIPAAGGDQGSNACGFAARGGKGRLFGGSIAVKGSSAVDNAIGVWCTSIPHDPSVYPSVEWPLVEVYGLNCRVAPAGAKRYFDACADVGTIRIWGGSGSGPGGKWRTSGRVYVDGVLQ